MKEKEIQIFKALTLKALQQKDSDSFITCLTKRNELIEPLMGKQAGLDGAEAKECLERETIILERLEKEKEEVIRQINRLVEKKKAARKYSSKFPIPPMPVFFDLAG